MNLSRQVNPKNIDIHNLRTMWFGKKFRLDSHKKPITSIGSHLNKEWYDYGLHIVSILEETTNFIRMETYCYTFYICLDH